MQTRKQLDENIKQIGLILLIVFLSFLIICELKYFASSILGAFTLYVILRKPHRRLIEKGWHKTPTTIFLLTISFLLLVVILGGLINLFILKLKHFDSQYIVGGLYRLHDWVIQNWNYDLFSDNLIPKVLTIVGDILPAVISTTGNVVANVFIMLFVLFFLLQQSVAFEQNLEKIFPFSHKSISMLKKETHNMIISSAVGIPLIMLGQGLTATLAYWLLDVNDPVVWGILTSVFGLIPIIGTATIWIPLAIDLFSDGYIWQSIVLLIYGTCIIFNIDNLVRMVFLRKKANIHPLITLFGVILGIQLFGFWGIIFGPLIISVLILLIKIYREEFE